MTFIESACRGVVHSISFYEGPKPVCVSSFSVISLLLRALNCNGFLDIWSACCEHAWSEPQCLLFPDHLTFTWSLCSTVRRAFGVFSPWLCALCIVKGDRRASRPIVSDQETPQNDTTCIKYSTASSVFVCQKTLKETMRAFFWRWPGLHPCLGTADPRLTSQVNIILLCMASPAYEHTGMPRSGDSGRPMND